MTTPTRAKITALGTYVPPRVLSNADLEKMVDTTNEWILERVGIRERHIADKGVAASDLAVAAVKNLLESHRHTLGIRRSPCPSHHASTLSSFA